MRGRKNKSSSPAAAFCDFSGFAHSMPGGDWPFLFVAVTGRNSFGAAYLSKKGDCMTNKKHWSIREVSTMLGIPEHRIAYQHRIGLREPAKVAGKRIYNRPDVVRVAKHFGIQLVEGESWKNAI
jgi:hypothetical protein